MDSKLALGSICAVVFLGYSCARDHDATEETPSDSSHAVVNGTAGAGTELSVSGEGGRACQWPSSLAARDANTRDVCTAARAFLSCDARSSKVDCASDDARTCADAEALESPVNNCRSHCEADEYAAFCGGIGPGPVPEPPPGCRFNIANPGGVAVYCCPCN